MKTKEEKRVGELRKIEERTVQKREEPGRERKKEVLRNETDQISYIVCIYKYVIMNLLILYNYNTTIKAKNKIKSRANKEQNEKNIGVPVMT